MQSANKDQDNKQTRREQPMKAVFDSDSFLIYIDNCATVCVTNNVNHFIRPLTPTSRKCIKGMGDAMITIKAAVMIQWLIQDNKGHVHQLDIPNTMYVPDSPVCLLLPQLWAQEARNEYPNREGTYCKSTASTCTLYWD